MLSSFDLINCHKTLVILSNCRRTEHNVSNYGWAVARLVAAKSWSCQKKLHKLSATTKQTTESHPAAGLEVNLTTAAHKSGENILTISKHSNKSEKKNYPFWVFFNALCPETFIFVGYLNQCFLVSLSVDTYLHLRKDSQQVCSKVLVWYVKSFQIYNSRM